MDKNWQKVDALLDQALDIPASEREKFLDAACGGDDEIRAEIESLLACETNVERFLQVPALSFSEGLITSETTEDLAGREIGRYRIVRELGRGGMGAVYLAERTDEGVHQLVALKLLKRELNTADIRRRFSHERQILAGLDHPQITHLIDVGSTNDGVPFFVMEYVDGVAIDEYRRRNDLSVTEVLSLFRTVCDGIAFAHRKLVVHRDLKPPNILVTDEGIPKLLDFGIAKLLTPEFEESSEHTVTQLGAMSLHYASPEQLRGSPVSTATDIYSLGVVLYELLAGRRPFERAGQNTEEIIRSVCETEPQKPSVVVNQSAARHSDQVTVHDATAGNGHRANPRFAIQNSKHLRGDLDNVVLMALRKEPERRYTSVEEFSEDLRRYLAGLPVIATKDTFSYRAVKFVARHQVGVVAALLILLAIASGSVITTWEARAARLERDKAKVEQAKAERINSFLQDMLGAAAPESKGADIKVLDVLGEASKRAMTESADKPEVMADVLLTLGRTYMSLGQYEPAETDLRAALNASLTANGEMHATTASILGWLGLALASQDKLAEGEAISRKALDLDRKIHPTGHEDTGVALYALGVNLIGKGDSKAAEPVLEESSELIKNYLGGNHGYYMACLTMLGHARQVSGEIDAAEANYRQSISIGRAGEYRYRIFLGQALAFLGELLIAKKNYTEAESVLRESERIYLQQLGPSNYSVGLVESDLGWLYFVQNDYVRAEMEYTKAFATLQKIFVPERPALVSIEAALGLTLTRLGKPRQGEPFLRQVIEIRKRVLPPGDVYIYSTESSLGECLTAQKRYAEAELWLLESYNNLKPKFGVADLRVKRAAQLLEELYNAWNKPTEAVRYREQLLANR